jgi:hypothetical protein
MNSCRDTLRGGIELRDPTGLAIVLGIDGGARGHRKHRRLPCAEQRPHRILGGAPAVAAAFRQTDRNVYGDDRRLLWRADDIRQPRRHAHANFGAA